MTQRQYRLDFRKEDVSYIMDRIGGSVSCSMVGVGSVGKSNLIAHLLNPVVQMHYLPKDIAPQVKLINIDANMLAPLSAQHDDDAHKAWAGFELLMHRLFTAFYPFDMLSADDARSFYTTYQALQDGRNPLFASLGVRYFELGLSFFLRRGWRIVFLFDEFEAMLTAMPIPFFLALRGLRDSYKSQLSYLAFARTPLPRLVEQRGIDLVTIEPFIELFNDHVRFIGPYNQQDSADMVASLSRRASRAIPDATVNALLEATGRFAGLLRAGWSLIDAAPSYNPASVDEIAVFLGGRKPIRLECRTIWDSLSASEQAVLRSVVRSAPYTKDKDSEDAIALLLQKKLLRLNQAQNALLVEPPVLRYFIEHAPELN